MYQQIQALNTEKALEIRRMSRWIVQKRNFSEF
jgi:hypothetical protein